MFSQNTESPLWIPDGQIDPLASPLPIKCTQNCHQWQKKEGSHHHSSLPGVTLSRASEGGF